MKNNEVAEEPGPIEQNIKNKNKSPSPRYPYVFAFEPSVTEMRHMKRIVRTNEKKSRPRKPGLRSQCLGYVNTTVRRGGGSEETNYTYFHTSFEHNSNKEAIEEFDANNRKMATRLAKKDKMKSVNMEKVVERPQKFSCVGFAKYRR
ncbi:unnamed protein product [Rhizophagus irregularis]|nr:unnamed protein product [Rhizophagus irregularis]